MAWRLGGVRVVTGPGNVRVVTGLQDQLPLKRLYKKVSDGHESIA